MRAAAGASPGEPGGLESVRALFPELEVEGLLGRGGMGVVYRARQRRLDRPVALKLLVEELAEDPAFSERFVREARALAVLDHPNVVRVHDFGEREGTFYLLMELVDGVGLRDVLRAGTLEPAQALAIVPEICAGLQYAHERGVVHRDIKPENILLDREGRVKIADFGLAKLLDDAGGAGGLTRTSQVMGTPQYMAPEQVRSPLAVDHRADIYSLGVVFYEMLTGELPVGSFPAPSRRAGVDARLDEVVLKTLEREPERRYQRASEVGTDVESVARTPRGAPAGEALAAWVRAVPGAEHAVAVAALVAAWGWMIAFRDRVGTEEYAWLAGAYPPAFLATRAAGILGRRSPSFAAAAWVAGFLAGVVALALVSGGEDRPWSFVGLSALTMALAHLFLERWVATARPAPLLPAALLATVGTVMHASMWYAPSRGLYYYSTGTIALLAAASALVRVPAFALGRVPAGTVTSLLRAFGVAAAAALAFFHSYVF